MSFFVFRGPAAGAASKVTDLTSSRPESQGVRPLSANKREFFGLSNCWSSMAIAAFLVVQAAGAAIPAHAADGFDGANGNGAGQPRIDNRSLLHDGDGGGSEFRGVPFSVSSAGNEFVGICPSVRAQLCWRGKPVKLKGFNYYPQVQGANGWSDAGWNASAVARDMALLKTYRVNCIRLLIPYSAYGWSNNGVVDPAHLERLATTINLARQNGIRTIVTLHDWYFDGAHWPAGWPTRPAVPFDPNNAGYKASLAASDKYLLAIVRRFVNEPAVLAWDLKNEPDGNYFWSPSSTNGWKAPWVMHFLARARNIVKTVDRNHLVTVGAVNYFTPAITIPQVYNLSLGAISDFISFHDYTHRIAANIDYVRKTVGAKPVLLEEVGWPTVDFTGGVGWQGYPASSINESEQLARIQSASNAAARSGIAGVLIWELYDHVMSGSHSPFGVIRQNASTKPAARYFSGTGAFPYAPFN